MAPYVSHDNPTGWDRSDQCTGSRVRTQHAIRVGQQMFLPPGGLYRTTFNVPMENLQGRRVHLAFHAVGSAVMVWVDGQPLGSDSKADIETPASTGTCFQY